jgi:hypothetical protein
MYTVTVEAPGFKGPSEMYLDNEKKPYRQELSATVTGRVTVLSNPAQPVARNHKKSLDFLFALPYTCE